MKSQTGQTSIRIGWLITLVALGVILPLGLMLLSTPAANAQLSSTSVVYAWDESTANGLKFVNSNATIYLDGGWVPFLHQLQGPQKSDNQFDTTAYITTYMGININTPWAGLMDYSVGMTDTNGAPGFRTTRRWSLVFCDRNNDQAFDNAERALPDPMNPLTGYYGGFLAENLTVIFQNVQVPCTNGTCQTQLVTRLLVNLDKNPQDNTVDAMYRVGGLITGTIRPLCFYAEAQKAIQTSGVLWGGNLQGRVTDNGGDKTVNFSPQYGVPTAVTLSNFGAEIQNPITTNVLIGLGLLMIGSLGLGVIFKSSLRHS